MISKQNKHFQYLVSVMESVKNPYIDEYLKCVFQDSGELINLFLNAPASQSNRGAFRGGLVDHVRKVMHNALSIMQSQLVATKPPEIDRDIVIAGVMMHDIGKAYAYAVDEEGNAYTTQSGHLLQHLPMSYGISIQAFIQAESKLGAAIPESLKNHINHCILAHHGVLEYGSPVKPMSIEAHIVHVADMADSTTSNFAEDTRNYKNLTEDGFITGTVFSNTRLFVGEQNDS